MINDIEKRFPFDAYPKGRFPAADSREVDSGQVVGPHYFGSRLICYRGSSGTPYVLDAYCPITEFRAWARQSYQEALT